MQASLGQWRGLEDDAGPEHSPPPAHHSHGSLVPSGGHCFVADPGWERRESRAR